MNASQPMIRAPMALRHSACLVVLLAAGCVSATPASPVGISAADRGAIAAAVQVALESNASGVAQPWQNPDTGNHGSVLPIRTYQTNSGLYCRDYSVFAIDDGATQTEQDTACRDIDGTWKDSA